MKTDGHKNCKRHDDRGVSILIIAVSMVFVLGMAGLGIDLASLYVGRSQAQRAADAGAIAAAQYLAKYCTAASGSVGPNCQASAKQRAVAVTNTNYIAGISPGITTADVTFLQTSASDPQIQVIAGRDTAHNNPMPTFFVKIFGITQANVSAKAVAEAYNPSGGNTPSAAQCVKPWLLPNCNPNIAQSATTGIPNANCVDPNTGTQYAQFVNTPSPAPSTLDPSDAQPVVPEDQTRGQLIQLKSSDPSQASGPSQFFPVFLPPGSVASSCPACANGGGGGGTGPSSGAYYRQNIECCNYSSIPCGPTSIQPITGNMVGPTGQGVDCLIHQVGSTGQDSIDFSTSPYTITAGSNNPYGYSGAIDSSDSIVTLPLYDGAPLCPGGSCPSQVNTVVVGFLQVFIQKEVNGNVSAYVMNVVGCPGTPSSSGGANSGSISGGGSSPVPVRLIHE